MANEYTKIESKNDPLSIYKKITKGFTLPGKNIYESGSAVPSTRHGDGEIFSSRYDEPTYLTFRIHFEINDDSDDIADNVNGYKKFDSLPHPLLKEKKSSLANISYSTVDYLRNNLGETVRADMLERFIKELDDIQTNYPYYFTSIEGLSNYLKIDTKSGRRVKTDSQTITIKCNEALDMKITQLMSLYRKIVWDDVYQRWAVPDMMRFFKTSIYISEIRVFHDAKIENSTDGSGKKIDNFTLINDIMNEIMPTIRLELEQCEFDISDTMEHLNSLKSSRGNDQLTPSLKLKVGNVKETHIYGLNKNIENLIKQFNSGEKTGSITDELTTNEIISDDILQNYYYTDEEGDGKLNSYLSVLTGDNSPSSTLSRYGETLKNNKYTPLSTTSQDMMNVDSAVLSSKLPKAGEVDIRSNTAAGFLSNLGGTIVNNVINEAKTLVYGVGNKIESKLKESTAGSAVVYALETLGDIARGDTAAVLTTIRNAIFYSTAVKETKNLEMAGKALRNALQYIDLQKETANPTLIKNVEFLLNSGMSATDIDRYIVNNFNYQKGTSNEVIDDLDNGYKNPGLVNPSYISSATSNQSTQVDYQSTDILSGATNGNISESMDKSYKGTSNEVIDDLDNGYKNPGLVNPKYISTATSNQSTQVDYQDTDVLSAATNNSVSETMNYVKGTSNEAIDDLDNGYKNPGLINPKYISTAVKS